MNIIRDKNGWNPVKQTNTPTNSSSSNFRIFGSRKITTSSDDYDQGGIFKHPLTRP